MAPKPRTLIYSNVSGRFRFRLKRNCCYALSISKYNFSTEHITNVCTWGLLEDKTFPKVVKMQLSSGNNNATAQLPKRVQEAPGFDVGAVPPPENLDPKGRSNDQPVVTTDGFEVKTDPDNFPANVGQAPEADPIYYDKTSHDAILQAIENDLENIQLLLSADLVLNVDIFVHTDSPGNHHVNRLYSQQLSKMLKRWLKKSGIHPKRITATGMGESHIINKCIDGTPCSDAMHKANRRIVFKFYR